MRAAPLSAAPVAARFVGRCGAHRPQAGASGTAVPVCPGDPAIVRMGMPWLFFPERGGMGCYVSLAEILFETRPT